MTYQILKRVTEDYDEIFTKEKETGEIHININGIDIIIVEQQCGTKLSEPYIIIDIPKDCIYEMNLDSFLKRITQ